MTNTFKTIAITALAAATMVAGITSSNASGMNALASFEAETTIAKVGFFKKNGKFTNRGVAAIGVGAAVVGGLLAKKAINARNNSPRVSPTACRNGARHRGCAPSYKPRKPRKDRCRYIRPARGFTCINGQIVKSKPYNYKPRHVAKPRYQPRVYKPVIAFNQNVFNQQTWLNQIGYNAGVADGKMGRNTRTAAMQFQIAYRMPATGYLTPQQTSILAQQANLVLAQRANQQALRTVATQQYAQPVGTAPIAYAPQVRYAPAPTTQVLVQPQVQYYAPAQQPVANNGLRPIQYAPQVQYVVQPRY